MFFLVLAHLFLIIIWSGPSAGYIENTYSPCVVSYVYFFLMQEHHYSMLQRETEKLRSDIEKMRSELRHVLWSNGNVSYFF